jgi:twitching motility protein PilT
VKSLVRQGMLFKLPTAIETGAADGCWSFSRYSEWLARKTDWQLPSTTEEGLAAPPPEPTLELSVAPLPQPKPKPKRPLSGPPSPTSQSTDDGVFVIQDEQDDPSDILRELERK